MVTDRDKRQNNFCYTECCINIHWFQKKKRSYSEAQNTEYHCEHTTLSDFVRSADQEEKKNKTVVIQYLGVIIASKTGFKLQSSKIHPHVPTGS